jgi:hypothetical protein
MAPQEVLTLAEQGARVTPLAPHSKKPILSGWQLDNNSSELKQLEDWANDYPDCNWGLVTGECSRRWALDIDCKNTLNGFETYQHWIEQYGPEWTFTLKVRTSTGGLHLYFPWQSGIRRSVGSIASGIDVLSTGSFAVIPPSEIGGRSYQFEDSTPETDLASIPHWLWSMVEKLKVKAPRQLVKILDEQEPILKGERHEHLIYYLIGLRSNGASLAVLKFAARDFNRRLSPAYDDYELDRQAGDIYRRYRMFQPWKSVFGDDVRDDGR